MKKLTLSRSQANRLLEVLNAIDGHEAKRVIQNQNDDSTVTLCLISNSVN